MFSDSRGLPLTAANPEAVAAFEQTLAAYLRFDRRTGDCLKATLKADPEMVMAHCLLGYFMHLMGVPALSARAAKSLAAAQAKAQAVTTRERGHITALACWCAGDLSGAVAAWEAILLDHPQDLLALKLAHFLHFYLGDSQNLRDSVARVLPAWNDTLPGYSYVLALRAFGLEECGDYAQAEAYGRQAVERDPADIWGVHAVAHVMEMQDRYTEGVAWLDALEPHWSQANNFRYHVVWHRLLFLLGLGRYDEVLARYDSELWDAASDDYLDLSNDAALLQRLEIAGCDVGDRWQALLAKVKDRTQEHLLAFAEAHFALILAAGGGAAAVQRLTESLPAVPPPGHTTLAILHDLGRPLYAALAAYRTGDYAGTVERLSPLRYALQRLGGSHAQRDLFAQILIDAALKSDNQPLARALLAERLALRPDNGWGQQRYSNPSVKISA